MSNLISRFLDLDPMLAEMWRALRAAGALRTISMDVTRRCNLRCAGCYFFAEEMDRRGEASIAELESFIDAEAARGTNFITVLGGEPSLAIRRLRLLAHRFGLMVVTNGLKPIPMEGLEDISIAVSVWGDRATDRRLRGYNKIDIFDRALANFRNDPRVIWYITLPSRPPRETVQVVDACVDNRQLVGFNYYGDLQHLGGDLDHGNGFREAHEFVESMIARHSANVAFTSYLNTVISSGQMMGVNWGHAVCASISANHPANAIRIRNGQPFSPHFRAYNADLRTTRRCCVGEERDCSTCYDVWAHMSWILLNLESHLKNIEDFTRWLSTAYVFYGVARLIDSATFRVMLPQIHHRLAAID